MKERNNFRFIMTILFIIFITIYISQATGYYDYHQHKQVELTAEKIKEFEQDVKDGKNIDVKDYLTDTSYNYNNSFSQTGLRLSKTISDSTKKGVNSVFRFLEKLFTD